MTAVNGADPWILAGRVVGDKIGHLRDVPSHFWTARQWAHQQAELEISRESRSFPSRPRELS